MSTVVYLKVEGFITVEDQHEAAKLVSEGFHRLCLSGACRT